MSKVTLLAVNAKYVHTSLAVWTLAAGIAKYAKFPHDVKIVEATINQTNEEIIKMISSQLPDVVGISAYIWNAKKLPEIIRGLKEQLPNAKLVLGGPEASFNAKYWLDRGGDEVIIGEGERKLPNLLDGWCSEKDYTRKVKPLESISTIYQLETNPIDPYTDEYFKAVKGRLAYIETSRGCPFSCAFCLSAGDSVRFLPLEIAKAQILKLSKSEAKTIKFVDRTFNCNPERAYQLLDYILSLDTHCCFHFEVAADLFDERTISLLKTAPIGRIQLEAGLQSFFEPTIEAVARKTSLDLAEENIREIMQGGNIHLHVDLIAGLPYETLAEFKNSFDRAYALKAHTLQLGFLKLLHGSKLRLQADKLGMEYSKEAPYEISSSPWLSAEDIKTLKKTENALQHTANKGRFSKTIEYVLSVSKMKPFEFFLLVGEEVPNHGKDLSEYATEFFSICLTIPNVEYDKLRDCMLFDWLGMVKGKNMPYILKSADNNKTRATKIAEESLGRKIRRDEAATLSTGQVIYVDSENKNPVTGLYFVDS